MTILATDEKDAYKNVYSYQSAAHSIEDLKTTFCQSLVYLAE